MYSRSAYILALATALTLGACSSTPERIDVLEEARIAITNVDAHPDAGRIAGDELAEAKEALQQAEYLRSNKGDFEDIHHHAYLALRHAEIAEERIAEAETREAIERSKNQRAQAQLRAREAEAQRALARAEVREREAAAARSLAEARETEAEEARELAALQAQEAARQQREAQLAEQRAQAAIAEQKRLEAALTELGAKKTERGYVLTLGDILFDTDRSGLKPGALKTLAQVAEVLREYPERNLLIEGHADARGAEDYNLQLSEARANAVRVALIDRGIDPARLDARGLGERYPVASNETTAGQQENRRVEIVFSDIEGSFPSTAMRSAGTK